MKKILSVFITAYMLGVSPGLECYQAAAQFTAAPVQTKTFNAGFKAPQLAPGKALVAPFALPASPISPMMMQQAQLAPKVQAPAAPAQTAMAGLSREMPNFGKMSQGESKGAAESDFMARVGRYEASKSKRGAEVDASDKSYPRTPDLGRGSPRSGPDPDGSASGIDDLGNAKREPGNGPESPRGDSYPVLFRGLLSLGLVSVLSSVASAAGSVKAMASDVVAQAMSWSSLNIIPETKAILIVGGGLITAVATTPIVKAWIKEKLSIIPDKIMNDDQKNQTAEILRLMFAGFVTAYAVKTSGVPWNTIGTFVGAVGAGSTVLNGIWPMLPKTFQSSPAPFSDITAGIGLALRPKFESGDEIRVKVNGENVQGTVEEITLYETKIQVTKEDGKKETEVVSNSIISNLSNWTMINKKGGQNASSASEKK